MAAVLLARVATSSLAGLAIRTGRPGSWTCKPAPIPQIAPIVAPGFKATLVITNLTKPRSVQFDPFGKLLVLEKGDGIRHVTLSDQSGGVCVVKDKHLLYKPEVFQ